MNDSDVSLAQGARWLVFVPQLPAKPDYLRVKLRRILQRIGAVAVKRSVYLLPNTPDAVEDFEWLRNAIVTEGGDAMLWASSPLAGLTDAAIEALFREARDSEYREIIDAIHELGVASPSDERATEKARLRRRLDEVNRVDFFGAPGWQMAEQALYEVEHGVPMRRKTGEFTPVSSYSLHSRTWVTREGVFVDRIASAWLIRRFIDPRATFKFAPASGYRPLNGELRFDMFDGEFTHEGERCTFETLLARFDLDEPALRVIAEIVHDVDCKDDKFGRPEARGVESVLAGIVRANVQDDKRIELGGAVFDGLYASAGGA